MFIKKVLEYSYNYAEYIVSDGKNDVICMCISVPLADGKVPKTGMEIENIFVFSYGDLVVKKIESGKPFIKKTENNYFGYEVQGEVSDAENAIISAFGFKFSLAYCYPNGLPDSFNKGDLVRIFVDRFDCEIKN